MLSKLASCRCMVDCHNADLLTIRTHTHVDYNPSAVEPSYQRHSGLRFVSHGDLSYPTHMYEKEDGPKPHDVEEVLPIDEFLLKSMPRETGLKRF